MTRQQVSSPRKTPRGTAETCSRSVVQGDATAPLTAFHGTLHQCGRRLRATPAEPCRTGGSVRVTEQRRGCARTLKAIRSGRRTFGLACRYSSHPGPGSLFTPSSVSLRNRNSGGAAPRRGVPLYSAVNSTSNPEWRRTFITWLSEKIKYCPRMPASVPENAPSFARFIEETLSGAADTGKLMVSGSI